MIKVGTRLKVVDNSGAKIVECIKILTGSNSKTASVGDIIKVSIKKIRLKTKNEVQVKGKYYAMVIRVKKKIQEKDGILFSFRENSVILLTPNYRPVGTRIFGTVIETMRKKKIFKLISISENLYNL